MDFFAVCFVVNIESHRDRSLRLLTSMELILTQNCNLLYFHSKSECNQLKSECNQFKVRV